MRAKLTRFTVVDDFGMVINPLTLEGQIHGGVAQGVGQALYEFMAYDEDGQLLSGSLMDYTCHGPMICRALMYIPAIHPASITRWGPKVRGKPGPSAQRPRSFQLCLMHSGSPILICPQPRNTSGKE